MSDQDPAALAREVLALEAASNAEHARGYYGHDAERSVQFSVDSAPALARAVLALTEERDAALRKIAHYEETLTSRQRRHLHEDGSWCFEVENQKLGALMEERDALRDLVAGCAPYVHKAEHIIGCQARYGEKTCACGIFGLRDRIDAALRGKETK